MGEFVFDIQRFSNLGTLKTLGGIIKTLSLVKLAQDLNKAKDASKWLKENANPILKFIGSTPFGKKFGSYSALITNSILIVDNALSVLTDKTLSYATRNSKIGVISGSLLSMANATNKLSTSLKKKNLWFLSIFSGGISLAANLIAASDGVTLEEKKAINKSYVAFLTSLGSDLVKEIFSAAVEKQLSRAFTEELTTDLVEEIMTKGKFFQAASKTLTKTFGVVLSLATGALNAIDEHKARMEKYTEDGIPEDIAKHDAFIDAFATFVHDNLSVYFKGVDNWVFEFMLGVVGGETEKNYIEVIADQFKTLNYKNSGTSGDDSQETFITSFNNKSYIYGDNGNDSIQNVASNVTIWGGHDNDTIWSVKHESETPASNSIFGGPGNDFVAVQDTQSTIYGGKGNDFLLTQGTKNIIYGDAGNDSVVIDAIATGNSIYGGLGDDLIFIESGAKKNKFFYTSGDGNDTIYNFGASDSLTVSGKFSTVKSGSDIKVKVGKGSILLVGATDKKIYINGNILNDEPISSGTFTPIPYPTLPSAPESPLISGTSGDDRIENFRSNVMINSGKSNDSIMNGGFWDHRDNDGGSNVTIDGGADNDLIYNDGSNVTIDGSAGNDSISNGGYWIWNHDYDFVSTITRNEGGTQVIIDGGAGNDSINNYGTNSTIDGGAGNDSIYNGDSYEIYPASGVKINGGTGNDFIDIDKGNYVTISGGAGNDIISLYYYARNNLIVYNDGDGNDSIKGFDSDDTLQIGGGTGTYFSKRSGDDLIVTVGKGKITLQGAANLSTLNIDGVWKDPTLLTVTNSTKSPVTVDSAVETVDASSRTKAVKITGNALANTISGGSANDTLSGEAGNDSIKGGAGNDSINGGEGNDRIAGDAGKDTIFGGNGNDFLYGGADNDTLSGDAGNDTLNSAAGNDSIKGGAGNDSINGGDGNDRIAGDAGKDTIFGGNGNDFLYGGADNDTLSGDAGNDTLNGAAGNDSIKGGDGNDSINGGDGKDTLDGGKGNDILLGGAGNDSLNGGKGNDTLDGGAGADKLLGNAGNDSLNGGKGNDTLDGGADSDRLYGGAGNDCIKGGTGKDSLWGDDGADKFFYAKGDGNDIIYGFDSKDTLTLDNITFKTSMATYDKSKGTLTLNVSGGSVTLKDFTATTFHINNDTYKISGTTLKKQ